ncbi:MAG: hypothetical protein FIB06_13290 [Betaproteobacteria bacterium]|nr:hypothetical protein [Betaproteobacteria bacterium]
MIVPYEFSWNRGSSLTVTYTGQTSDAEFLKAVLSEHGDYRFDTLRCVLHDFTGVTGCSFTDEALFEIDYHSIGAAFTNPNIRVAIVADRPDVLAMFAVFLDRRESAYPLRIFASLPEARLWLEEKTRPEIKQPG